MVRRKYWEEVQFVPFCNFSRILLVVTWYLKCFFYLKPEITKLIVPLKWYVFCGLKPLLVRKSLQKQHLVSYAWTFNKTNLRFLKKLKNCDFDWLYFWESNQGQNDFESTYVEIVWERWSKESVGYSVHENVSMRKLKIM